MYFMEEVIENFGSYILETYNSFFSTLPQWMQEFLSLFFLVLVILVYVIFVWKFYRFISSKNILGLNLSKYNKSEHPFFTKLVTAILYLVEYIIILPFLIFFWFGVLTLFLVFLTEGLEVKALLVVSATIIAVIRMTSYYHESLSRDLAKLLPFTLLAVSITRPGFFDFERVLIHFNKIPLFFSEIVIYFLFIAFLEIILRLFDLTITLFGPVQTVSKGRD